MKCPVRIVSSLAEVLLPPKYKSRELPLHQPAWLW